MTLIEHQHALKSRDLSCIVEQIEEWEFLIILINLVSITFGRSTLYYSNSIEVSK